MPAILRFLGYNPLPPGRTWAERLVNARTALGLSQKESAQKIGVDQGTLARWERGEREPTGGFAARATRFLASLEATWTATTSRNGIIVLEASSAANVLYRLALPPCTDLGIVLQASSHAPLIPVFGATRTDGSNLEGGPVESSNGVYQPN
jgi:transcriptional regulator with XRE-family HTH domain